MVDLPSSPLGEVDRVFEKLAVEGSAFTFGLANTTLRDKLLQNLAADVCRSNLGLAFSMHVMAATMHGITHAELKAAIRFVAPLTGYPAAASAAGRLAQIVAETGAATDDSAEMPAADGVVESLHCADDWMTDFARWQTARAWSETLLSERDRAILAITCDVCQHELGDMFGLHVRLALGAGLDTDTLRDVVRYCAEHGLARAAAAIHELDVVLVA